MIVICVPFLILTFLLQTRLFFRLVRKIWSLLRAPFSRRRDAEMAAALAGSTLFPGPSAPPAASGMPQDRKERRRMRRRVLKDSAKKASGRWTIGGWRKRRLAAGGGGLGEVELGRIP